MDPSSTANQYTDLTDAPWQYNDHSPYEKHRACCYCGRLVDPNNPREYILPNFSPTGFAVDRHLSCRKTLRFYHDGRNLRFTSEGRLVPRARGIFEPEEKIFYRR